MAKRITQLSELTTAAQDDYIVIVDTSTGTTKKITVKNLTGLPDVGWITTGESWSYSSYSSTTKLAVITIPTDGTAKYSIDMWVRFSQSTGGTKYGQVTAITATTMTVFMGSYTLNNEAISSPVYSTALQPFGLPESAYQWKPWVPSWTNITVGGGTVTANYIRVGKTVIAYIRFVYGAGSAVGNDPTFTVPVTAASKYAGGSHAIGSAYIEDFGATAYDGSVRFAGSATVAEVRVKTASGAYVTLAGFTSATPFTWGTSDYFQATLIYESA